MNSLFIDTHDKEIIITLFKNGKVLEANLKSSERHHSDFTMPMIESVLKNNNLTVHELDEILVVNGPGSFTGVRIGVTIAKTLAYTLNIPIKTITSLECLAVSSNIKEKKISIIRDVKGVFCSLFDENNNLIAEPSYMTNSNFDEYIKNNDIKLKAIIEESSYDFEKIYSQFNTIEQQNAHEVKPIYIKEIEALKNDKNC